MEEEVQGRTLQHHHEKLKYMCRLCGKLADGARDKYTFAEELKAVFSIDVSSDNDDIQGDIVCNSHVRLTQRHLKCVKDGRSTSLLFEPCKFPEHTNDGSCVVCNDIFHRENQTFAVSKVSIRNSGQKASDKPAKFIEQFNRMHERDRLAFLKMLPDTISVSEKAALARALGHSESYNIFQDSNGISQDHQDISTYKTYNCENWLKDRNVVIKEFLLGTVASTDHTSLNHKQRLSFTKAIEQIYHLRNQRAIMPLSFLQSMLCYAKTGSQFALNVNAAAAPSGSYTSHQKFLDELPQATDGYPLQDLIVAFDNEQVYRGRRGIQTAACTSIITNIAYVAIDKRNLQFNKDLCPRNWNSVAVVPESERHIFEAGVNDILEASSPKYKEMEEMHQRSLANVLQKAMDDCIDQHSSPESDAVDDIVVPHGDTISCPFCNTPNSKLNRNCHSCGTKGAITLARKQRQASDNTNTEQPVEQPKFLVKQSTEVIDHRYQHIIPHKNTKAKEMTLGEPVLCNPSSKDNIMCILRHIGQKAGISLYDNSGSERQWLTIVVDGLIYLIIKTLKEQVVLCRHPNCMNSGQMKTFISLQDLSKHYLQIHEDTEMLYCREFEWVLLKVADGHYEHTVLRAYFDLNWVPFLLIFAKELGFTSDNQLNYVKACKDHHLSWEIFVIVQRACLQELVLPYVRHCLQTNVKPSAQFFLKTWVHEQVSPGFTYLFEQVCTYGHAIYNLRAGVRQNNVQCVDSAKHILKELLWARHHPKYQVLELYDNVTQEFLHQDVKDQLAENYALVTETTMCGQGYDYRLEELNRVVKNLLPSCLPSEKHWHRTCSSAAVLEEVQKNALQQLGIKETDGHVRLLRKEHFEKDITKVRGSLRSSGFLGQQPSQYVTTGNHASKTLGLTTLKSTDGTLLHPNLLRLGEMALMKRIYAIETDILGMNSLENETINHPVYATPDEEAKYCAIENQTNAVIDTKVKELLEKIPDNMVGDLFKAKYRDELKRARKDKLLKMYYTLEDMVQSMNSMLEVDNTVE